jgi:glycosyltransferase involved in cell wall biosynthesis
MIKLSVVIITYNEERNIERCIQSVKKIADEILVIDSFSTDTTQSICLQHGVSFIRHPFEGHIQQKNVAIQNATYDWILSLDADEALTPELETSIAKVKESPQFKGYSMNRRTNYCGHWVKHCGWYPDTKTRFIHRQFGAWTGLNPHDKLVLFNQLPVAHLAGDLLHYSYYTREDHLKQIEYFGDIAAKELFNRGKKVTYPTVLAKTIFQFVKTFFLKKGFLDGKTGFTIAHLSAFATFRKYTKLKDLYKNAPQ